MKLLIDNNLAPRLGRGLGEFFKGIHTVIHIRDKFGTGSLKDEEWIELLSKEERWCVLTADRNIAKKRPSRQIFTQAGLIGFFPAPAVAKWSTERQCARILMLWPTLVSISETVSSGFYEMGAKGDRLRGM